MQTQPGVNVTMHRRPHHDNLLGISSYVWHQELSGMEFHSVTVSAPNLLAAAGTLASNAVVECVPLLGFGNPVWTAAVPNVHATSNSNGLTVISSHEEQATTFGLYRLPETEPLWSYTVPETSLPAHRHAANIAYLGDMVIAAVTVVVDDNYWARLYWFDIEGTPQYVEFDYGSSIRDTAISYDSRYLAVLLKEGVYVLDLQKESLMDGFIATKTPVGELCMSGDARFIGYGWEGKKKEERKRKRKRKGKRERSIQKKPFDQPTLVYRFPFAWLVGSETGLHRIVYLLTSGLLHLGLCDCTGRQLVRAVTLSKRLQDEPHRILPIVEARRTVVVGALVRRGEGRRLSGLSVGSGNHRRWSLCGDHDVGQLTSQESDAGGVPCRQLDADL
jgi:hypothetical protein